MTSKYQEDFIVGIDLGTTNSGVAIWDKNKQRPEIIFNIMNETVTPSVVAIQDGEIVVGNIAKNILREMLDGDEAATTHKRDMGTPTLVSFNGKKVPPYILGSYVLKALKKQAEDYLGTPVVRAVITVPAYFTQSAIEDTKRAGEAAGFKVDALLPESTAAALAFGQKVEENTRLMVYDLGGGTFDVSVIEAVEGQFMVRANDGNRYLGGDDFDALLQNYILEQSGYGYLLKSNHPRDKIALQQLNLVAEEAKIRLSSLKSTQVQNDHYYDSSNRPIIIDLLITRAVFEELIRPKIDESIEYCHRALQKAQVDIKNIKDILLVGGSTRIPYVATRIEQEFGIKPNKQINPMTCVTEGAAIHTRSLKYTLSGTKLFLEMPRKPKSPTNNKTIEIMGMLRPQTGYEDMVNLIGASVQLMNAGIVQNRRMVNNTSGFILSAELQENVENVLQLIVADAQGQPLEIFQFTIIHNYDAIEETPVTRIENVIPYAFSVGLVEKKKIEVLIEEQSALPAEATKTFRLDHDGQTELTIPIYEGKNTDPDLNRKLNEVLISNLPPYLKKGDDIKVTFQIDESRILHINVQVPRADLFHQKDIEVGKAFLDEQFDELAQEKLLRQYKATLISLENDLDQKLSFIPEEQRVQIGNQTLQLRQEAEEALQNKKIGKLGAKIEDLTFLNQEIEQRFFPDLTYKEYIAGIDLGTTNSGIAVWDKNEQRPVIITNIMNEPVTPSVVAIRDGELVVGNAAKNILREMDESNEAATSHKRDMGTPTLISFNGKKEPPYILGSYVLQALKKEAEDYLGEPVNRAVITVPAYFTQSAIEDTKLAGEAAGFEVEALLPEPTAAVLAFGPKVEENTRFMVYDLGGGTFDVSIIEAIEGQFMVRINYGNSYLGGDDFDVLLRNYILEQSGYDYLLKSNHPRDKVALQQINLIAEEAKIRLSTLNSTKVRNHQYYDSNNEPIKIDLLITRAIFEELIRFKIDESIEYCYRALQKAEMDIKNINDIIFVGGSTRIPYIAKRIEQEFGIKPNRRINPMTCVTEGAAIYTGSLKWVLTGKKLSLEMLHKPTSPTSQKVIHFLGKIKPICGYIDEMNLSGNIVKLAINNLIIAQISSNSLGGFIIDRILLEENKENQLKFIICDSNEKILDELSFSIIHVESVEIANQGTNAALNYLYSLYLSKIQKLYEAKLIIVGQGGVGKTCVMKKLIDNNHHINKFEPTTEGIAIKTLNFNYEAFNFKINIWDFGGQEIYRATHQFFLTERSLYLFVWEARSEGDESTYFHYWLNSIKLLSNSNPVIIVQNKIDERLKEIDQSTYKKEFPNIIDFKKISCLSDQGINELFTLIKNKIIELPQVGIDWPEVWTKVRKVLEDDFRDYITYAKYKSFCNHYGLNEEKEALFLSSFLHDLGVILHFQNDPILKNIVILKPEWGTKAVYRILDNKKVIEQKGRFSFNDLQEIWNDPSYPSETHLELLQLMMKFELCFKLEGTEEYIVPELLTPEKPNYEWDLKDNLQFEYHYQFMPAGIISRFIVRQHRNIEASFYWKNGVILNYDEAQALIISEQINRRIAISITGTDMGRQQLLGIIRNEFRYLHRTLNNPEVKEMIPCICSQCKKQEPQLFSYEILRKHYSNGRHTVVCDNSSQDISIEQLLNGFDKSIAYITKSSTELTTKPIQSVDDIVKNIVIGQSSGEIQINIISKEVKKDEEVASMLTDDLRTTGNENTKVIKKIKILFLAANPLDTERLRIGKEIDLIKQKLRSSDYRDCFKMESCLATRVDDLQEYLLRFKPDIVHFSGHSTASSEIILEDESGIGSPVPMNALSHLFQILKKNIRCVVLNSCFSEPQAKAISEYIDCVIGMTNAIADEAAINFAAAFYRALGYGESVKTAFELGCNVLDLKNLPDKDCPKLLAFNVDPSKLILVKN